MKNQCLIVAENIIYKNNKLTCINIYDKFTGVVIPAEFIFDLVIICGPNWDAGSYNLTVEAEIDNDKSTLGKINVNIPHKGFTYNAIANNIKLAINKQVDQITFRIFKEDEMIITRNYPIATMFNLVKSDENSNYYESPKPMLKLVDDDFIKGIEG